MKKKENKHNYKIIIGILLGLALGSVGVYAGVLLASEVPYTNNNQENVQGAIDDLYSKANSTTAIASCSGENCKCKKATTLHIEVCSQTSTSSYCSGAGYITDEKITYGQIGSGKTIRSGDALDCDVNGDGTYDEETERFYYVSNYYNTTTNQFDPSTAVLIYYNNVSEGIANNTATSSYYSSANENWHGPDTARGQLPKTSGPNAWSNVSLKNTTRAIKNELGGTTTGAGTLPTSYSYAGYAARLLTAQEINAACNIMVGSYTKGELNNCQYLIENTKFTNDSLTSGYWLETPRSSNSSHVWGVIGNTRDVDFSNAYNASFVGVRPAIEVSVTDIEY